MSSHWCSLKPSAVIVAVLAAVSGSLGSLRGGGGGWWLYVDGGLVGAAIVMVTLVTVAALAREESLPRSSQASSLPRRYSIISVCSVSGVSGSARASSWPWTAYSGDISCNRTEMSQSRTTTRVWMAGKSQGGPKDLHVFNADLRRHARAQMAKHPQIA
jgi:hypothetical protein